MDFVDFLLIAVPLCISLSACFDRIETLEISNKALIAEIHLIEDNKLICKSEE